MAIPLATRTRNSSKLRAKLGRRRANNTRLFRSIIAAGEYRFRRPVLPRERKRAIIDTAFCLEPQSDFLLNNCVVFFEYCVRHKVICVPGIFFDVNPFHRRRFHKSPYIDKLRMSYGPAWPNLKQAVKGMKEIIELAKAGQLPPLDEPPPTA